ncbi:MAG: hypothetical protein N3A54_00640 [Patescibacteria group bacterium]|nr:hypothetical protein [Patescibacteria group bacterium]
MNNIKDLSNQTFTFENVVSMYSNTYKMFQRVGDFLVEVHIVDKTEQFVGVDLRTLFAELYRSRENQERVKKIEETLKVLLRGSSDPTNIYLLGRVFDYKKKICSASFTSTFNGFCNKDSEELGFTFNSVEEIDESNSVPIFNIMYESSNAIEVFGVYDEMYKVQVENAVQEAQTKSIYQFLDLNKFHKWHYEATGKSFFEFKNSKNEETGEKNSNPPIAILNAPNKETIH